MQEQENRPSAQDVHFMGTLVNRTGIEAAADRAAMLEVPQRSPVEGDPAAFHRHRTEARRATPLPVGSLPPPPSLMGAAREAVRAVTGKRSPVLIDKLAERLAFERTGTRLYDTLIEKHDQTGGYAGGPERDQLVRFRNEESAHFRMLARALESLDADPTAVTPSADLAGVAARGVLDVVTDGRTTLAESLEAILIAELADRDAWTLLIQLAEQAGNDALARSCREAEAQEDVHLAAVRRWVAAHAGLGT